MTTATQHCTEQVSGEGPWGSFHPHYCRKPIKVVRDGKPYCTVHDPERVAAKRKEEEERWDKARIERERVYGLNAAAPALLAAARAALGIAEATQGEWSNVLLPYAPDWTKPFKDIVETLDAAIKQAKEGGA